MINRIFVTTKRGDNTMDYIEQMKNMRQAMHVVSEKIPTLVAIIEDMKRKKDADLDLNVLTMSDAEFKIMERTCEHIEERIKHFDPENEYGGVDTMSKSEMMGDPK